VTTLVPSRWPTVPLKHLVEFNKRKLPDDTDPNYEFEYIEIGLVDGGRFIGEPERMSFVQAPSRARRLVREGDTIVSTVRTYLRAVWTVSGDPSRLVVSTGFAVISPGNTVDPRFMSWWLQSDPFVEEIVARSVGVSYPAINPAELGSIRTPTPPLYAQKRIADFLDTKIARIDGLIAKKRRAIALAHEKADQSMSAIMAEYGFDFPGEMAPDWRSVPLPAGWRVVRLSRALAQLTNGYVGPTRDILVNVGIRYIQSLHVKDGEITFNRRPFYVSDDWHSARPRIHLRAGDVLIVQTGDIGKVAVVPEGFGPASCHALQIARVRRDMLSGAFLAEYLRTPFGYESLLSRATGALHPHLEGGIRDVPVVLPPKEAQHVILQRISNERDQQKKLESRMVRQIELLRERRQALVTAAVTGQMDLPGVSA
jgi:type I restriction enzyme S subunit